MRYVFTYIYIYVSKNIYLYMLKKTTFNHFRKNQNLSAESLRVADGIEPYPWGGGQLSWREGVGSLFLPMIFTTEALGSPGFNGASPLVVRFRSWLLVSEGNHDG